MRTLAVLTVLCLVAAGCGTTRWSDTQRTATEQLLLSDAVDRAVSRFDFGLLAGRKVYLDTSPLKLTVDAPYLISSVRQHLLACECQVKEKIEEADYVLELRAGAVGTDRNELLFGVPATQLPSLGTTPGPHVLPELPLAKRTDQRGVAKIAAFAYDRRNGRPVWQSGVIPVESKTRDLWVLGAGPFQRGSIHDGTKFAGNKVPAINVAGASPKRERLSVAQEAIFTCPADEPSRGLDKRATAKAEAKDGAPLDKDGKAKRPGEATAAGHSEAIKPTPPAASGGEAVGAGFVAPPAPAQGMTDFSTKLPLNMLPGQTWRRLMGEDTATLGTGTLASGTPATPASTPINTPINAATTGGGTATGTGAGTTAPVPPAPHAGAATGMATPLSGNEYRP